MFFNSKKFFARLGAIAGAVVLASCSSTGGPFGLSPAQEQAIGQQQHPQILAAFGGEVEDQRITAYAQGIFDRLMAASEQPNAQIRFTVLDSPIINAMALPGHVYITRGLLALGNSEAEIAGVIGHEIGHVFERHTAQRVSRGNLAQLGTAAIAILTGSADTAQLAGQAAQLYVLRFSRTQEYEADQVGVRLLAKANYDPMAEAAFLDSLGAWANLETQIAGRQMPPEYLSTHPNSAERVRRAAQEANVLRQAGAGSSQRNRDVYLNTIDGLLYGDDPVKQGFVQGRDFVHPTIGIAFRAPSGFELQNSTQAVYGRSQSGAQMQFMGAGSESGPAALINGQISEALKVDMSPAQSIRINGRNAAVGRSRQNTQNGEVDVTAYAIQWEGNAHYVFLWVTPAQQWGQIQSSLTRTAESLREIDGGSVNVPPARRIDVVTVQRGDTATSLGRLNKFPAYQVERFRVLNALGQNTPLQAGDRVKLVR